MQDLLPNKNAERKSQREKICTKKKTRRRNSRRAAARPVERHSLSIYSGSTWLGNIEQRGNEYTAETIRGKRIGRFAAFACMFALGRAYAGYHPPSEGEDDALAVAENLLTEIGQEFDREELRSIWRSDAFAEFRKLFGKFEQVGIADQPNEEIAAWCAELCQCARNGVSALEYDSGRSINGNSNNGNATHHGSK
jgi:hypothetical protein